MPRLKPPSKEESLLLPAFAALPDSAIHLPATEAEFAAARTALLAQSALGFDTESKPIFSTQQVDTGPHLVQLATTDAAWLLQLHRPHRRWSWPATAGPPRHLQGGLWPGQRQSHPAAPPGL
jgi:hypothetical protein